jgi:hypothetical protein
MRHLVAHPRPTTRSKYLPDPAPVRPTMQERAAVPHDGHRRQLLALHRLPLLHHRQRPGVGHQATGPGGTKHHQPRPRGARERGALPQGAAAQPRGGERRRRSPPHPSRGPRPSLCCIAPRRLPATCAPGGAEPTSPLLPPCCGCCCCCCCCCCSRSAATHTCGPTWACPRASTRTRERRRGMRAAAGAASAQCTSKAWRRRAARWRH